MYMSRFFFLLIALCSRHSIYITYKIGKKLRETKKKIKKILPAGASNILQETTTKIYLYTSTSLSNYKMICKPLKLDQ